MIAKVIVDVSLDREFDYTIPSALADKIKIGSRITIPFGHRHVEGYVVGLAEKSTFKTLKPIKAVIGDKPYIDNTILKLARWMSSYYCASLEQCIRTLLPGAVRRKNSKFKKQRIVKINAEIPIFENLKSENLKSQISKPESLNPQSLKSESLKSEIVNPEILTPAQQKILDILKIHNGEMPLTELLKATGTSESPIKTLAKKGILTVESCDAVRNPLKHLKMIPAAPLPLMPEQAAALDMIIGSHSPSLSVSSEPSAVNSPPTPILLYGVTGSGKTEVYLQAIAHELEHDRGSIILVPEISLTPQTIRRFQSRFGTRIAVLHSHLSDGERHDEWHRILNGEAMVVIGARSAVFAPVRNLGLLVVDEEHEPGYKQSESPRYNARDVAVMRGHFCGCKVLLGSATPAIESWANTKNGKYRIATLSHRADDRSMPSMRIVDMRIETERTGHANVFSKELLDAIQSRLQAGEQTILFLNRRGYSSSLVCPKCGYVSECSQCSVSHTYHRSENRLRCHICGGSLPLPLKCPQCSDPSFRFAGMGTQRVEAIIKKCFPHARTMRMDADTTGRKAAYEEILGDFRDRKIDILVGTQMIAKGLHFPNVTLVGVVYADLSLHVPDFRAAERTYQLLAQVSGRAGRGDVAGEVIVQTYTPHHTAIQAARRLDYEGLCAEEIEFRSELLYPPATHLICITLKGRQEPEVKYCTEVLAKRFTEACGNSARISEACPAPLAKAKNYYRYQIMARGRAVSTMVNPLKTILNKMKLPKSVTIAIDVDALDLM
jgi:primosomal protein N' (replication factor Y)